MSGFTDDSFANMNIAHTTLKKFAWNDDLPMHQLLLDLYQQPMHPTSDKSHNG